MKKRTKKYNPKKSADAKAQVLLKNYVLIANVAKTGKEIFLFHTKLKKCFSPNNTTRKLLDTHEFIWSYVMVVYSTMSNGKERVTSAFAQSPYPSLQREVAKSLNDAHSKLIADEVAKGNNFHNAAWVAIPCTLGVLSEEEQDKLIQDCIHYLEIYDE